MRQQTTREDFIKNKTAIMDENLEPYFITKNTHGGYNVCVDINTTGTPYVDVISHPSTLGSAVRVILNKKKGDEKVHYSSIKEYVKKYDDTLAEIRSVLNF